MPALSVGEHSCLVTEALAKVGRAMLSDRAHAKAELADKNVGPTGKKTDAPGHGRTSIVFSWLVGVKSSE